MGSHDLSRAVRARRRPDRSAAHRNVGAEPAGQGVSAGRGGRPGRRELLPSGQPAPSRTSYQLSAWLGGTVNSWAEVTVRFLSAANRVLASRTIGPVGRSRRAEFAPRTGSGVLPAGTTAAQVTVVLATSLTNANGWQTAARPR
ncbi:MAG TPA: hypothetical protein VHO07_11220 [Streptosporangiaceae bacterium]|nr:hypothetical protein [Streptosporangiaceae bacterium]